MKYAVERAGTETGTEASPADPLAIRDVHRGLIGLRVWSWMANVGGVVFALVAGLYFAHGAKHNDGAAIIPFAAWLAAAVLSFALGAIVRMMIALVRPRVTG